MLQHLTDPAAAGASTRRRVVLGGAAMAAAGAARANDLMGQPDAELVRIRSHIYSPEFAAVTLRCIDQYYPTEPVRPSSHPHRYGDPLRPPLRFSYEADGRTIGSEEFLTRTSTNALLAVRDGRILYERYRNGGDATSRFLAMSMSKSINALLVGLAIKDGALAGTGVNIAHVLPGLKGTAYDGVTVEDALQMRSGVHYAEYGDDKVHFNERVVRTPTATTVQVAAELDRVRTPGRPFSYSTLEATILGDVVEATTGRNLAEYTHSRLWEPAGMASPASWMVGRAGGRSRALAGGGLSATARDLARLGEIVLARGRAEGRQILPAAWVDRLLKRELHTPPDGRNLDYQDQWWIERPSRAIVARGYMGQLIYLDPPTRTVVVKFSYVPVDKDFARIESEMLAGCRAIAQAG